jgi:hypothetical protein
MNIISSTKIHAGSRPTIILDGDKLIVSFDTYDREHTCLVLQDFIENNRSDHLYLTMFNVTEAFLNMDSGLYFKRINDIASKVKYSEFINCNLMVGEHASYSSKFLLTDPLVIDKFTCYPYTFLNRTINNITSTLCKSPDYHNIRPSKHAICYNGNPILPRAMILDGLAEIGMLKNLHYSWMLRTRITENLFQLYDYYVKNFDYKTKVVLDHDDISIGINQDTVDDFLYFNDSLIEIGAETNPEPYQLIYTEKTWKPILLGKFFLLYAHAWYYENLEKMGFQLYDEVFDYSFDQEFDTNKRLSMYIDEVKRLLSIPIEELQQQLIDINHKVIYNKELAIKLNTNTNELVSKYSFMSPNVMRNSLHDTE